MALIRVSVSDYDITKGVPEYNWNTKPYPRLVNGESTWQMPSYSDPDNPNLTHSVISSDDLLADVGVAPRRSGNNYAVTEVISTPGGAISLNHSPRLDYVPFQHNSTLTYSKWVYVKKAAGTDNTWGFGLGFYDSNYVDLGGQGDSVQGTFPSNQWVRINYQYVTSTGAVSAFLNTVLSYSITGLAAGDVVVSTDYMSSYEPGLVDYFDGNFAGDTTTDYQWSNLPEASASTKTVRIPTSVKVFPPENVLAYSVTEDAMSLDPADFSGGYGEINFDIDSDPDLVLLRGKTFELEDGDKGKTTGVVTGLSGSNGGLNVTTDSMLGVLNSWGTVPASSTTFDNYMGIVFNLVGLDLPVRFEDGVDTTPIVAQTYVGNLWDMTKQVLSANQIEMSLVYNTVVFRPFRTYEAYMGRATAEGVEIASGETAKAVEVTYYNSEYVSGGEFYPEFYDDPEYNPPIMQVDAGETVVYTLQTRGTMTGIADPIMFTTVPNEPQTLSVYSVVGSDDLPITQAQWNQNGGNMSVVVNEFDPSKVDVTVTGANVPHLAPFRIAMSSGSGNYYNSLHLVGTGVRFTPKTVRIPTGASTDTTGTDVGVTVQNPFINDLGQAYTAGVHTAARFSGLSYSVNGSAWDINRRNYTGGVYAQVKDFNASRLPGDTVADFNASYAGMLIADFNALWDDRVSDDFPVQAFGNAAGARVRANDAYFRISRATFGPADVSYSAALDTMVEDFNEVWDGATVADFNAEHFNKFVRDFSLVPLRRNS